MTLNNRHQFPNLFIYAKHGQIQPSVYLVSSVMCLVYFAKKR